MKTMFKSVLFCIVLVTSALLVSQTAIATGSTGYRYVKLVRVVETTGAIVVDLDVPSATTEGCATTNAVVFDDTAITKYVYAGVLSAIAMNKQIYAWVIGCVNLWGTTYPHAVNFAFVK